MELTWQKWLVMAALALISIFLGLVPLIFFRRREISASKNSLTHQLILSALACFGGGVLVATCLCHMLIEAREDLEAVESIWEHLPEEFPLSEVLSLVGFILIYVVEEIAHFLMGDHHHDHGHGHHHHHDFVTHRNAFSHGDDEVVKRQANGKRPDVAEVEVKKTEESNFEENDKSAGAASILRSMLALIALSFHAIMEGVAIGVQESAGVWFMFGAVASHKFVISFCMGMELFAARTKLSTHISSIVFFGVISPVGILIGSLISGNDTNILPIAVIKGLSTGTLLYVVFFEILNREREKKSNGPFQGPSSKYVGFLQCLSLTVGIVAMILLLQLHVHDHHHHHDEDGDLGLSTTTTQTAIF